TEATRELLVARHGADPSQVSVLPQGYDLPEGGDATLLSHAFEPDLLEIVYTGGFYGFRNPRSLVEAVLACDGVRWTIASRTLPEWLAGIAADRPDKVRVAG